MLTTFYRWFTACAGRLFAALALVVGATGGPVQAQTPAWQRAAVFGGVGTFFTATAPATDGGVYVAGSFARTLVLGATTLVSVGTNDVFVAKWSPATGDFVWALRAGGPGDDFTGGLAVYGASVYLAGVFTGTTAAFGPAVLANANPRGTTTDVFVAKLTDAGPSAAFAWAQAGGGPGQDGANALAASGAGVYVAGSFADDPAHFGPATLTSAGHYDAFVAKLTDAGPTGSFVWAQRAGSIGYDEANALAVSGSNVYVAGGFYEPGADFGPTFLTCVGVHDVFVAKLVDTGPSARFAWVQGAGSPGDDVVTALAVSGPNVYVAGSFQGPYATFGSTTLACAGPSDAFVAKLTDAGPVGRFAWAQRVGGTSYDQANALAVNGADVLVAGYFSGATAAVGDTTLTNAFAGDVDVFVTQLVDAGPSARVAWAQRAGGTGYDAPTGLVVSGANVYVAGVCNPPAGFGPVALAGPSDQVPFLAVLGNAFVPLPPAPPLPTVPPPPVALGLFPNPARAAVTVQLPAAPSVAQAVLTLVNAMGQPVRTYTAAMSPAGGSDVLDVAGLSPGVYLLLIQTGATMARCRLAIE